MMKKIKILLFLIFLVLACSPLSTGSEEEQPPAPTQPTLGQTKEEIKKPTPTVTEMDAEEESEEEVEQELTPDETEAGIEEEFEEEIEQAPSTPEIKEATPGESQSPPEIDKWSLWVNGPHLRGANIWQRVVVPDLDGDEFLGSDYVGPPYTQADFDRLAALGANYVNISHPGLFTETPPYVLDKQVQANLDRLLQMVARADMFAVITFRTGPGRSDFTFYREGAGDWFDESLLIESVWSDQAAQDAWAEMWRYTAQRYRDNPIVVGYDLMCEPNAAGVALDIYEPDEFYPQYANTLYDWNQFYPRLVEAIRAIDPDTPVLVSGMGWGAVRWLPSLVPTDDDRTVYMVHQYEPQDQYTHQEPPAANSYPDEFDLDWDGAADSFDRDWLAAYLSAIDDFKSQHHTPVAVNEFGVMRWTPNGAAFMDEQMALFEQRGMNHALWSWDPAWTPFTGEVNPFNFRFGPDPNNRAEVPNELMDVITQYWTGNTIRPSNFGGQTSLGPSTPAFAYETRPDGAVRLTDPPPGASDQNPAFSPDGTHLIFTRFENGYNEGPSAIYLLNLTTGNINLITTAPDSDSVNLPGSSWNAATGRITFSSDREDSDEIWTMAANGSDLFRVTHQITTGYAIEPSFSPDGQWIVFEFDNDVPDDEQQGAIWKVRANGAELTQLTEGADDRQPNWSPAGDLILFQRRAPDSDDWNLYTMAPDGSDIRQVTTTPSGDTDASWSPDGQWLVYSSDDGDLPAANIFVIPAGGGKPARVTRAETRYDGAPSWSPNGRSIAFESYPGDEDAPSTLWLSTTLPLDVSPSSTIQNQPLDKTHLADVANWFYMINVNLESEMVDQIVDSEYDMVVLDFIPSEANNTDYPMTDVIAQLHNAPHPKLVIAYIDIGQAEDFRTYWQSGWGIGNPEWIVATDPDGWEGNYPVAYWNDAWRNIWLGENGYLQAILEAGFDGVYLDWVEAYSDENIIAFAQEDGVDPRQEMIWWVGDIAEFTQTQNPDFIIIAQNAAELAADDEYLDIIDAIAQEQVWFDGSADNDPPGDCPLPRTEAEVDTEAYRESLSPACREQHDEFPDSTLHVSSQEYLRDLTLARDKGEKIFTIDYALEPENVAWIYETSRGLGFVPFASNRALDQFVEPHQFMAPASDTETADAQGDWWQPAVNTTWQWQLEQTVDPSFEVDMYDIEMFDNDADMVANLHAQGRKVICYISAGSWEEWRPDADQFPASVIGNDYGGWPGEKWLDIRQIDVLAPIMQTRLDECQAKGFDGIEPDNIDGYTNDTGFPLTYDDQLNYNLWLANEAHTRGLSIGLKNDAEQVADLLPYFDWALTEDCFAEGWCEEMLPFIEAGKPVFAAEYTDMDISTQQFCPQAREINFSAILKNRELDAWREACP